MRRGVNVSLYPAGSGVGFCILFLGQRASVRVYTRAQSTRARRPATPARGLRHCADTTHRGVWTRADTPHKYSTLDYKRYVIIIYMTLSHNTLRNENSCFPEPFFLATFFHGRPDGRPAKAHRADTDGDGLDRSMPAAPG